MKAGQSLTKICTKSVRLNCNHISFYTYLSHFKLFESAVWSCVVAEQESPQATALVFASRVATTFAANTLLTSKRENGSDIRLSFTANFHDGYRHPLWSVADEVFVPYSSGVEVRLLAQLTAQCNPASVPCRKPCQEGALHDAHTCFRFELKSKKMAKMEICLPRAMKWLHPWAHHSHILEGFLALQIWPT